MANLLTCTVTFIFTDIVGSTRLWEQHPEAMKHALARHDALVRGALEAHGGYVFKAVGDGFCAAFATARDAAAAALAAQRALQTEPWGETGPIKARIALHTGAAQDRNGDYFGPPVNRVARLLSSGHGGQILLSLPTAALLRDVLPEGTDLRDLGEHQFKDLQRAEHVFQLLAPDLSADFPALRTLDSHPNNLPAQATPFIGREREVEALRQRLLHRDARIVTVTGPGGIGKTRLSLQVAADLLHDFASGAFFVPLAPIADPDLVASAIAQALGVKEEGKQPLVEGLKVYLRDKSLLLVLDNFEQVVNAAPLVGELVRVCPQLKVLVTSRAVLRVYGEHEFSVPTLQLPDLKRLPPVDQLGQYEAVRLFIERAQDVRPDFAVTNENAPAVAEICYRLDGLPLAIELAAARTKILTPQEMLSRLGSRLKTLVGGARDLPARQQTLRNAIGWSYDLLHSGEQTMFRRLGVFAGSCGLEAAEVVCNVAGDLEIDLLDGLASLVDNSLLRQEEAAGGVSRFLMLETIREYAVERLAESGEVDALRQQHARYFASLAEKVEPKLITGSRGESLERLHLDDANLRAALASSTVIDDEGEVKLRLAMALRWYWYHRGYLAEGRRWLADALAQPRARQRTTIRAKALHGAGLLSFYQGDLAAAHSFLKESVAISREVGDRHTLAYSLIHLGMATFTDDLSTSRLLEEESAALFHEIGDRSGFAQSRFYLGVIESLIGDAASARIALEESKELYYSMGDKWGLGGALNYLGLVAHRQGDIPTARLLMEESLALFNEVRDSWRVALALSRLGHLECEHGDYQRASTLFQECLRLAQEIGDKMNTITCLRGLGEVAIGEGRLRRGVRLLGAAEALLRTSGLHFDLSGRSSCDRGLETARRSLDEQTFTKAWTEGQPMTLERAVSYALAGDTDA